MTETFDFAPDGTVPVILPPDPAQGVSMNGWAFTSRPSVPYQKKFKVTLYGIKWVLEKETDFFDTVTDPQINARRLELFYERQQTWKPFLWLHPHLGPRPLMVKFNAPLNLSEGLVNSAGLIDKVEMTFIHDNPAYSNGLS